MRSKAYSSPSRHRRKAAPVIIGSIATLVIVFVVLPGALSTGRHPSQGQNTTTTTMSLADIQRTYQAVLSGYDVALAYFNAVIATAAADITTQEQRAQNDAKNYHNNASGIGCSGNPSDFASCLADEQQTAQAALADETAATRAAKADLTKQIKSVQQIETAITVFVQQLDGITWPSSLSSVTLDVTHALSVERSTYAQVATDFVSGKSFSADSQTIAAAMSAVTIQLITMASALGIPPPPPSPPSS